MAKQPEMRDVFRITAEVEVEQFGFVVAQLTKLGLKNFHHELVTEIATFGRNGQHDSGSQEFALQWIADHPTFRIRELSRHFKAHDRNINTAHFAVRRLVELGTLVKLGNGQYRRADVKEIAPPAGQAPQPPNPRKGRGSVPHYAVSNKALVTEFIANKKSFQIADLTAFFADKKRPKQSATSVISKMTKDGFFKMFGEGSYEVLKKPPKEKQMKSKTNGDDAHV